MNIIPNLRTSSRTPEHHPKPPNIIPNPRTSSRTLERHPEPTNVIPNPRTSSRTLERHPDPTNVIPNPRTSSRTPEHHPKSPNVIPDLIRDPTQNKMHLFVDILRNSILITGLVVVMMMMIESLNIESHGMLFKGLRKTKFGQVIIAALLGSIPGCMGGFATVSLYTHRLFSFGALVAMMIASSGDEAFVMLAMIPDQALAIFAGLFILAVIVGILVDMVNDRRHSKHCHKQDHTDCGPTTDCSDGYIIHEDHTHNMDSCCHSGPSSHPDAPASDSPHGGATGTRPARGSRTYGWKRIIMFIGLAAFIAALATGNLGHDHGVHGGHTHDAHVHEIHTHGEAIAHGHIHTESCEHHTDIESTQSTDNHPLTGSVKNHTEACIHPESSGRYHDNESTGCRLHEAEAHIHDGHGHAIDGRHGIEDGHGIEDEHEGEHVIEDGHGIEDGHEGEHVIEGGHGIEDGHEGEHVIEGGHGIEDEHEGEHVIEGGHGIEDEHEGEHVIEGGHGVEDGHEGEHVIEDGHGVEDEHEGEHVIEDGHGVEDEHEGEHVIEGGHGIEDEHEGEHVIEGGHGIEDENEGEHVIEGGHGVEDEHEGEHVIEGGHGVEGFHIDLLSEDWMNVLFAGLSVIVLLVLLFASDHFVEEHLWNHIVKKHLLTIFAWTFGVLLVLGIGLQFIDIEHWISDNVVLMILLATLIGIIPESGPHLIFVTLYAAGVAPLPVLIASCISQDGHASIPLLAESRRSFLLAKVINCLVALIAGFGLMLLM